jgi:XTP/dITP diphosphohydrolase
MLILGLFLIFFNLKIMDILIASYNEHKIKEIQQIISTSLNNNINIINPELILKNKLDVEENGNTFEENAFIKAKAFFDEAYKFNNNIYCMADDSGLQIDALNGDPGIYSARFAGTHGNDSENRKKVLQLMENLPIENRTARFVCVICLINRISTNYFVGTCEGKIGFEEIGTNGFGYDSIFIPDGYYSTFAEMDSSQKNKISHRSLALNKFIEYLKDVGHLNYSDSNYYNL